MKKIAWKPGASLWPLPAVMVSCGTKKEDFNIITIAWTGIVNSKPPMTYISVRPERHSYDIIKEAGEFVINLTTVDLVKQTDWCGVKSGRDFDKFAEMKLTPQPAQQLKTPLIAECPINLECVVKEVIPLGSHDMFLAEIVAVNATEAYIDPKTEKFSIQKANFSTYLHGTYCKVGEEIGTFGFSVMKKKTRLRKQKEKK